MQHVVGLGMRFALGFELLERRVEGKPFRNAGCQFTLALKLFVNLEVLPTGVVLRRGNSRVGKILKRRLNPLSAFVMGGLGDHRRDRVASSFAQNAIGLTGGITINLAAPGSMALPRDAGELQGASIC